jgi:cytoplasmic iron level regulating protein YaaA (DUF328/UPF0246 family)
MREDSGQVSGYQRPLLMNEAEILASYIKNLSVDDLAKAMHLSKKMSSNTWNTWQAWDESHNGLPAIDAFLGDIYSGLQSKSFTLGDRSFANKHLYIISGLYGALRALDSIKPYRLELGYKLPRNPYDNLYKFWGDKIANQLPANKKIINLSSNEYAKVVLPYFPSSEIITPKFMTLNEAGQPVFVTVHAKISRGAFAGWLIKNRIDKVEDLNAFSELNYKFDKTLSSPQEPVFICKTFGGIGLSVRLS